MDAKDNNEPTKARPRASGSAAIVAWFGRDRHTVNTRSWFQRMRRKCGEWPGGGLDEDVMILMINALPIMAKTDPRLFQASINSLLAQNPGSEDWRRAIRRRVMMIQREETARLRGDRILLAERRDAWGATKQADGSWRMRDGRSMDEFMDRGREGRRSILRAATLLHGLVSIEIPKSHMAGKAWARELRRTAKWLNGDHPALVEARESGRTWHLAVRRTKRLRIRGAFDAATQTIVVDPRHPETLRHELAHWVLRHDGNSTAGKAETDVEALLLESLDIRTLQMEQKTL